MASWIKMRTDLSTDPAVVVIARATRLQTYAVVGRLHTLWSWADTHTTDGRVDGIDAAWVDKYLERKGFAEAMVQAGWLTIDAGGIVFPKYTEHNGATAKRRAKEAKRKGESRSGPHSDRKASASNADNLRNREDKRREEEEEPPKPPSESGPDGPGFLAFWHAYPARGRTRMSDCKAAWGDAVGIAGSGAQIVSKAEEYAKSPRGSGKYCLAAHRWLTGRCWEDAPEAWQDADEPERTVRRRDYDALASGGAA